MHSILKNKAVILTGASGGIGQVVAYKYIEAGAKMVLTGRNINKLELLRQHLILKFPKATDNIYVVVMDNSISSSVAAGVKKIIDFLGKIDVLINNAGSAGSKSRLRDIPLVSSVDNSGIETLNDSIGSLLIGPWLLTRALFPYFNINASIINVSTIFSRTKYYGRAAYVVPKAALNVLSKQMAIEFGKDPRCIRVNTVFPGPVESERIYNVFADMDKLRCLDPGATSSEITSKMTLQYIAEDATSLYVSKEAVADTIQFLGGAQSKGFTAHNFDITHGMQTEPDDTLTLISNPDMRVIDLENKFVWVLAINNWQDAWVIAVQHVVAGANVLLTLKNSETIDVMRLQHEKNIKIQTAVLDINDNNSWLGIREVIDNSELLLHSVVVVTDEVDNKYGNSVLQLDVPRIEDFLYNEFATVIVIAKYLDAIFANINPRITFSSCNNKSNDVFSKIINSGVQQLLRIWRHETNQSHMHQLIRYQNGHSRINNSEMSAMWAVWLSNCIQSPRAIDLILESNLMIDRDEQSIRGMHLHKVALITGGSEGIGKQITKLLALAGARVVVASRDPVKLEELQKQLINELKEAGYSEPEQRILIIPNANIEDSNTTERIVKLAIAKFGRIDLLVNNAGIVGEEQMVADMSLDGWRTTLKANLISNYDLMLRVLPQMRARKSGHIINMSSHFGGMRHATVVYPNRADYALSKSGQRILAEDLAEFLGPDVQINAVAPGPVFGARIHGVADKPGLYQRRSRLILENKRLNSIYESLLNVVRVKKIYLDEFLYKLASNNKIETITGPEEVMVMLQSLNLTDPHAIASKYLLNRELASKLLRRLKLGMFVSPAFSDDVFFTNLDDLPSSSEDLFSKQQIAIGADKIRDTMMHALALQRMPSEADVAREVVFYLANTNVTGETLYPSCGLALDHFVTVTEWIDDPIVRQNSCLQGKIIMMLGGAMVNEMATVINSYAQAGVAKIIIFVVAGAVAQELRLITKKHAALITIVLLPVSDLVTTLKKLPSVINQYILKEGNPSVIVAFPISEIQEKINDQLPSLECFENLIDQQISYYFVLSKRVCLIDHCRMIAVTSSCHNGATRKARAFSAFFKSSLRTLMATVSKEASLLSHQSHFFQIESNCEPQKLVNAIIDLSCNELSRDRYHTGMILKV